ncbi:MAG: glycosyltransferase [Bacteriovoracaceae bacterium]
MKIQTEGQRILVVSFSVLIITHGREELLLKCLDSLRAAPPFELVLFANGLPLSHKILDYLSSYPGIVRKEESPIQLSPGAARNKALTMVTTEWVHLIDDDSYWQNGYWQTVSQFLSNEKIDVLGGPDGPAAPMSYFQESVSIALSSPLCTGVTFARHQSLGKTIVSATEEKLTSCNLWIRSTLIKAHPFPEDFSRAEETWLLQGLERAGARMFYHPLMKVGHYRRKNLFSLVRPTLGAGFWRSRLIRKHGGRGAMFWMPSIFVLLHLLIFANPLLVFELAKVYVVMILAVSMGLSSKRNRFWHFPLVALLHYVIVFLYGTGFLLERGGMKWN